MLTQAVLPLQASAEIQPDPIVLSGTIATKNSMQGRWLELIYTEAFKRLGYPFRYESFPAKRASALSDAGWTDGEISRVQDYAQAHPDLIRVEEPHFVVNFSAYAADPTLRVNGWPSLSTQAYRVTYRAGVKLSESMLPGRIPASHLSAVATIEQGLEMLAVGRTDLFIDVEFIIEGILAENERIRGFKLHKAGVMETLSAHAFLHKRHAQLVPKLAQVLRAMKAEGVVAELYRKANAVHTLSATEVLALR